MDKARPLVRKVGGDVEDARERHKLVRPPAITALLARRRRSACGPEGRAGEVQGAEVRPSRLGGEHDAQRRRARVFVGGDALLLFAPLQRCLHVIEHILHVTIREEPVPSHRDAPDISVVEQPASEERVLPRAALTPRTAVEVEHERFSRRVR